MAANPPLRTVGGIPYEKVADIARELRDELQEGPTYTAVIERLRQRGIPFGANKAHSHFKRWEKEEGPAPTALSVELTPTFVRATQQEIALAVTHRTESVQKRLDASEREARDLAQNGELLEQRLAEYTEQLAALTQEREQLTGRTSQLTADLERLTTECDEHRKNAELARIEAAEARLASQRQQEQLAQLKTDLATLRQVVERETTARIEAQRQQAALQSKCEGLAERVADLQGREQTALGEIRTLREQLTALTESLRNSEAQRSRAEGEAQTARAQGERMTEDLAALRAELARVREEHAPIARAAGAAEASLARAEKELHGLHTALTQCREHHERLVRENSALAERVRTLSPAQVSAEPSASVPSGPPK